MMRTPVMVTSFVLFLLSVFCECRNYGPNLTAPATLQTGDYMTSNNSQYHCIMQPDGNLVIYRGSLADQPEDAHWATGTSQRSNGPYHADLEADNDFVLRDVYQSSLWSTKTSGKGQPPARLVLQGDGNLLLIDGNGKRLWWSEKELKGRLNRIIPKMNRIIPKLKKPK